MQSRVDLKSSPVDSWCLPYRGGICKCLIGKALIPRADSDIVQQRISAISMGVYSKRKFLNRGKPHCSSIDSGCQCKSPHHD